MSARWSPLCGLLHGTSTASLSLAQSVPLVPLPPLTSLAAQLSAGSTTRTVIATSDVDLPEVPHPSPSWLLTLTVAGDGMVRGGTMAAAPPPALHTPGHRPSTTVLGTSAAADADVSVSALRTTVTA